MKDTEFLFFLSRLGYKSGEKYFTIHRFKQQPTVITK